ARASMSLNFQSNSRWERFREFLSGSCELNSWQRLNSLDCFLEKRNLTSWAIIPRSGKGQSQGQHTLRIKTQLWSHFRNNELNRCYGADGKHHGYCNFANDNPGSYPTTPQS